MPTTTILLILVLIGFPFVMVSLAALRLVKASRLLTYPTTDGQVTEMNLRRGYRTIHLNVSYTYNVVGMVYQGVQKQYASSRYSRGLQRTQEEMPTIQPVHYNPSDPSDSGLKIGLENVRRGAIMQIVIYLLMAVAVGGYYMATLLGFI